MRRPKANRKAFNPNRGKGTIPYIGHKSFAEVLQGATTMAAVKASMTIKANEGGHGWFYESVIIRLNSDFSINSIKSALKDNGLAQVVVRQGGGRDVILTFKSQEELQSNIQKIKDWFKDWSHGILLNLWNRNTLNNIGALWETVLQLEGDLSQPKSFFYSRIKVVTTCMELINKTINLECKGKLHPVFVCEDHSVNPVECNGMRNIGLGECNSSSNVDLSSAAENDFADGVCKRKDDVDSVAKQYDLSAVAMPSSIVVAQRKELSQCNSREAVDTVVEETRCDVEVSRPTPIGGKEAMMEERAPCTKNNDHSQRYVEHASAPGLFKSISGSIDGFGPGINLELALGHLNNEHIVKGPILMPFEQQGNRECNNSLFPGPHLATILNGSGTMSLHDQGPVRCPASILNPHRSAKKAGKKKVQIEGFSCFARLYGLKFAGISKHSSKSVIFKPTVVARAHSELSDGESSSHSYPLKEAQATVKLRKDLGINFRGQEDGVVDKILELELKVDERL